MKLPLSIVLAPPLQCELQLCRFQGDWRGIYAVTRLPSDASWETMIRRPKATQTDLVYSASTTAFGKANEENDSKAGPLNQETT